jgi:ABC-type multidrug transport system ATPase subunit
MDGQTEMVSRPKPFHADPTAVAVAPAVYSSPDVSTVSQTPEEPEASHLIRVGSHGPTPLTSSNALIRPRFVIAFEGVSMEGRRSIFRHKVPLLQNLYGVMRGGVHAVVCTEPSVSRKALEVLAGLEHRSAGSVMANGLPAASSSFRRHVGYIRSADVCMTDATARENLLFSVRMRLDTNKEDRVVLEAADICGLRDKLDTTVLYFSDAEKLHLAISMELITDPSVIVIEAPLRFLTVSDHTDFVVMLRRLSANGLRTVILSLQSLPWLLYDSLDGLVLLSQTGHMLYGGPRDQAEGFFAKEVVPEGSPAPRGEDLVDLMMMWEEEGEIRHVANTFDHSLCATNVKSEIRRHREAMVMGTFPTFAQEAAPAPGLFVQNGLLLSYTLRRALLRPEFLFSWIGLFVVFFLLAALSANQQVDQNGMQNKRGIIFLCLSVAIHVNITFLESEVSEYASFVHMRNNRYFGVFQYFFATVLRLLIPRLLISLIGAAFTAFVFSSAIPLCTLFGLTSLAHASLLLLMTYWWPVTRDLTVASLIHYLYCVMFSGFLVCLTSIPSFFGSLSILRPGYGGAVAHELKGLPFSCDAVVTPNITWNASYCYTGNQYLEMEGFLDDSWGVGAVWLVIEASVTLCLLGISMKVSWID